MSENKTSIIIILGLALSALVGAVFGVIASLYIQNPFSIFGFGDIADKHVDQKIVELIEEESATIAVVDRVTPSVVSIIAKKERGFGLTKEEAKQKIEVSSGSGFFVSEDGYILTNKHVVNGRDVEFSVVTSDNKELSAKLIDSDSFQDIAILKVDGEDFPTTKLGDSDSVKIGQTVIAIGNTLSEFRNTVTKGVISGINRRITASSQTSTDIIEQAIQTDAAINPGNSGGPLINLRGEIIGINTAISIEGESVAFAIPINQAKRAINDVHEFGRIIRPWLGIRYVLVQPSDIEKTNTDFELGAMIISGNQPGQPGIFPESPAEQAGLKEDDIIISIDDKKLSQKNSLSEIISKGRPGQKMILEVLREGVLTKIEVTLAEFTK